MRTLLMLVVPSFTNHIRGFPSHLVKLPANHCQISIMFRIELYHRIMIFIKFYGFRICGSGHHGRCLRNNLDFDYINPHFNRREIFLTMALAPPMVEVASVS